MELLKSLCELDGVSGREDTVCSFIIEKIKDNAEVTVDNAGNIIAFVKGEKAAVRRVMVDAHMDEVGVIVTYITDDGMLKFHPIGINVSVLLGRRVRFGDTVGVIGTVPIHLQSGEGKEKLPEADLLYIDIGVSSRAEAERFVRLGDVGVFHEHFEVLGDLMVSKAFDNRIGCWALIDIINSKPKYDFYATFTVKEEVGAGARTVAFTVDPEFAVVLECTTAADLPNVGGEKRVCSVGKGVALSFMDRATLYDRELFEAVCNLADKNGIKHQVKTVVAGGNNAGGIHKSRSGVRTVAMSVPCRYIHSASCVASFEDVNSLKELARATIESIAAGELL